MLKLTALLILFLAAFSTQDTPIPPKPEGYSLGSNTPTLHIEAFFDLIDPPSKQSWAILEDLLVNEYNITHNKTLRFTALLFPQPQNTYSFAVTQGAKIIADTQEPAVIWTYINFIFENQDLFFINFEASIPQSEILDSLAVFVHQEMPSPSIDVIRQGLQYGSSYDYEARISWKYGCSRGVSGSPFYLANGVAIDGAESFTAAQWRNFLNGGYIMSHLSF